MRGSSGRSKNAMAKNLQKLGIGKKLKDRDSKTSSKSLTGMSNSGPDNNKKTTTVHSSSIKEKLTQKSSERLQNGDFSIPDGSSHNSVGQKKTIENGSVTEETGDGGKDNEGGDVNYEYQPGLLSDTVDNHTPSSSNEETIGLFGTIKNTEEKPFTRVSSV